MHPQAPARASPSSYIASPFHPGDEEPMSELNGPAKPKQWMAAIGAVLYLIRVILVTQHLII